MRILLVGKGAFYHVGAFFRRATEELGHDCLFLDESEYWARLTSSWVYRVAYHLLNRRPLNLGKFNRRLVAEARGFRPDLVLITKGPWVLPESLAEIKHCTNALLANYATDDPFSAASGTSYLVAAIPFYDLYVCTKRAIMEDVRRAGCREVTYVPFAYEPALHFPEAPARTEEAERFRSDVVFIGGADQDRVPYFEALLDGVPGLRLHLYGGYWKRYPRLRHCHRGLALGRDYRLALACTKIAPCLVRRSNRDGHVMRSFEVPACGAFMLAERTGEHLELFEEGTEAAYFGSPEELVEKTRCYLARDTERAAMAAAALGKVRSRDDTYKHRLETILEAAVALR
jgi:hypothetical protein